MATRLTANMNKIYRLTVNMINNHCDFILIHQVLAMLFHPVLRRCLQGC